MTTKAQPAPASEKQINLLYYRARKRNLDLQRDLRQVLSSFGLEKFEGARSSQVDDLLAAIDKAVPSPEQSGPHCGSLDVRSDIVLPTRKLDDPSNRAASIVVRAQNWCRARGGNWREVVQEAMHLADVDNGLRQHLSLYLVRGVSQ